MTRFNLNWDKTLECIDLIASLKPGITQYYVGKVLFFADREHFIDYGRPITGDKYVAMEHGPVPSVVRDILKSDSDSPDELITKFHSKVLVERNNNLLMLHSKGEPRPNLSGSDIEYVTDALNTYADMSFTQLKHISHQDPAYEDAWAKDGVNNEMNLELWLNFLDDTETALQQTKEYVAVGL